MHVHTVSSRNSFLLTGRHLLDSPSESDSSDGAPEEDVQKKNRKDDMVVCKKKLDHPSESRVRFQGDTESPDGTLEGQRANERRDDRIVCKKKLFTRNRHDRLVLRVRYACLLGFHPIDFVHSVISLVHPTNSLNA